MNFRSSESMIGGSVATEAIDTIQQYTNKVNASYEQHNIRLASQLEKLSTRSVCNTIWQYSKELWREKSLYNQQLKKKVFTASPKLLLLTYLRSIFELFLINNDKLLFSNTLPSQKFIYFPLHLMPESSTLSTAYSLNEYECIYQLTKVLPSGWRIAVKPNPFMFADIDFYSYSTLRRISELPNVVLMHPFHVDSKNCISKSQAVACLAGSALLEAAFLGKTGFCWSKTELNQLPSVYEFDAYSFLSIIEKDVSPQININGAVKYLSSLIVNSVEIDFNLIDASTSSREPTSSELDCYKQVASFILDSIAGFGVYGK